MKETLKADKGCTLAEAAALVIMRGFEVLKLEGVFMVVIQDAEGVHLFSNVDESQLNAFANHVTTDIVRTHDAGETMQ